MRKIFSAIAAAMMALSVSGCYRDLSMVEDKYALIDYGSEIEALNKRLEALEALCGRLNGDIAAIQAIVTAMQDYDFITSVDPVMENGEVVGYEIHFSKSGVVRINHGIDGIDGTDGKDADAPRIGIVKIDGDWYWTINDELLVDGRGERIKVNATNGEDALMPMVKIEEDMWYVSYDSGANWTMLGRAAGTDANDYISDIACQDGVAVFTLSDGTRVEIPMYQPIRVSFNYEGDATAIPGTEVYVKYILTGADENTFVTASSDGNFQVRVIPEAVDHGIIAVKCPLRYTDGYVNVIVSDNAGHLSVNVINFFEGRLEFPDGLEYQVDPSGADLLVPFRVNFPYNVLVEESAASWLTMSVQTKAEHQMLENALLFNVKKNLEMKSRSAKIYVYSEMDDVHPVTEIIVNQASAVFSIERVKQSFSYESQRRTIYAESSEGILLNIPEGDASWLSATCYIQDGRYAIEISVAENKGAQRSSSISIYSGDGLMKLSDLEVVQMSSSEEDPESMIFEVRATVVNDWTAYLPLFGNVDCFINWGDGSEEYVKGEVEYVSHKYEVDHPESFIVRISGKVPALMSGKLPKHSVTKVLQWGLTGLNDMSYAFDSNYMLSWVAADTEGAFSDVKEFRYSFVDCIGLSEISGGLFANATSAESFECTFARCSMLRNIPDRLFSNCVSARQFKGTFYRCISLESIPENLFAGLDGIEKFALTFGRCESLVSIPEGLFRDAVHVRTMSGIFLGSTGLTSVPQGLFAANREIVEFSSDYEGMNKYGEINIDYFYSPGLFEECNSLKNVPCSIFDNNRKVSNFANCFRACRSLEGESPYTMIGGVKYHLYERNGNIDEFAVVLHYGSAFNDASFSDKDNIPQNWK